MGLQVSRGICTQTTTEGDLRADTSSTGTNFPWSGATERMADYRRSPNARPGPHVHRDSAQASSRIRDGVPQREERDRPCPAEREGAEFLRGAFLGSGLCRLTVGLELEQVRQYIREQEAAD